MKRVDARDLVFLDESAANTAMTRSHAWVKKGTEPIELRPFVHWHQLTMCGAITVDGWLAFTTSWKTMNKERFTAWIRDVLAPRLRPGQIVIMDNLKAHHASEVRALIEARGAKIRFLPPYSPDLNPIEPCWAIVKKELRRCAIRDRYALRRAALRARHRLRPAHTKAFTRHSGYVYRCK